MFRPLLLSLTDDLVLSLAGRAEVALTPGEGLRLAEALARKSFRHAIEQEAARAGVPLARPRRPTSKVAA